MALLAGSSIQRIGLVLVFSWVWTTWLTEQTWSWRPWGENSILEVTMEVPHFLTLTTKVWQVIFLPTWTGDCMGLSLLLKVLHRLGSSHINISFVRTRPLRSNGCIIQQSLFCYNSPAYPLYSLSHLPQPTRLLTISFPYHLPPCYSEAGTRLWILLSL